MDEPIDRNNRQDVLRQIGRTEEKVNQINREISKIDKELDSWEKRKAYLLKMKSLKSDKISKHEKYINHLEKDLNQ